MENQIKIILAVSSLFFFGCNQDKGTTKYQLISCQEERKKCSLVIGDKSIENVILDQTISPIENFVDISSFYNLIQSKHDSNLVRNPYYYDFMVDLYFRDDFYLYATVKRNGRWMLTPMCKKDDFSLMGGAYIRIKGNVYFMDKQVENVDVTSFRTIDAWQSKREFPVTCGIDSHNIYYGEKKMSKDIFESLAWEVKDVLRNQYFNKRSNP